jgi:signal transduction histidine kinase
MAERKQRPQRGAEPKWSCFVSLHVHTAEIDAIARAVHRGMFRAGFRPVLVAERPHASSIRDTVVGEIARSDCVLADVTDSSPHTFFELGLAQAMGKAVLLLVRSEDPVIRFADVRPFAIIEYDPTPRGLLVLAERLESKLRELRSLPERAAAPALPRLARRFAVDWEALRREEAEDLCHDLLARMGLQEIAWTQDQDEIDLIARLTRRDPDGSAYRDVWLVAMGRRASPKSVVDTFVRDPGRLLQCLERRSESAGRGSRPDDQATITLLVILLHEGSGDLERVQRRLQRHFQRARERGREKRMRIRVWDRAYLTGLVQQFPELGYKYFGPERSSADDRAGGHGAPTREEHDVLAAKLAISEAELVAERNRRIRLERDAIWKQISFTALHQIVNPVFAIETFLDPLERRIRESRADEARQVIANIRAAVEKAKSIIEQFKTLARAQRIEPRPILLLPLLESSCEDARACGVTCTVVCPDDLRVVGDPDRLAECFRGIVTNGAHAAALEPPRIAIEASRVGAVIPDGLDSEHSYALVRINDRGRLVVGDKHRTAESSTNGDLRTGLLKSLARRIVDGHGGVMLEAEDPAHGTELDIYLPVPDERGAEVAPRFTQSEAFANGAS